MYLSLLHNPNIELEPQEPAFSPSLLVLLEQLGLLCEHGQEDQGEGHMLTHLNLAQEAGD